MGEGRHKRKTKRRRAVLRGTQKSCSDSEVAPSRFKDRKSKRDLLPWPKAIEPLTVDELARHRRRRVQDGLKDTLDAHYHGESHNFIDNHITEYKRAFRALSNDSLFLRDRYLIKAHEEAYVERVESPVEEDSVSENILNVKSMEPNDELLRITGHITRPHPVRRGTSLRRGGEFYSDTESANYKIYEGIHRAELARRPTSLKMEGDMQTVTEQCEKFIEWLNVGRPEPARIPTHLKLEGRLETSTESHDQYIPFVGARRPEILRQSAHLKLEGESNFIPEYADVFRPYENRPEKRSPMFPETHLKPGGEFNVHAEHSLNFNDPRGTVPVNDTYNSTTTDNQVKEGKDPEKEDEEEDPNMLPKTNNFKGPPLEVPEYKDAYKDFPRERPKLLKPEDEIGRSDGSKVHPSLNSGKFPTKIDQDPEYKSMYLDRGTVYKKPPISRRPSVGTSNFGKRLVPDMRQYIPTSEVQSQYVPYGHVPRVEILRMPINLRSEGSMNLQPEYRDAYCKRRDSKVVESRYRNRSLSDSRRRENNWINNNNSHDNNNNHNYNHDQIDSKNFEENAFQILHGKTGSDNLAGKPQLSSRRNSTVSQASRAPHPNTVTSSTLKRRSPSPTYRLHVCNVDDEPRGFARRRRSSSLRQTISPTANNQPFEDDNIRPYSPSFGKTSQHTDSNENQSFVILDNSGISGNQQNASEGPRRRFINNSNTGMTTRESRLKYRNKTPSNWMPPWYDNTSTI